MDRRADVADQGVGAKMKSDSVRQEGLAETLDITTVHGSEKAT